jgi:hypothetical protein
MRGPKNKNSPDEDPTIADVALISRQSCGPSGIALAIAHGFVPESGSPAQHPAAADPRMNIDMCNQCELEATNTANQNAQATSARLQGHGRQAHGRDAGRRRQNAGDNQQNNVDDAWNVIHTQTLRRLLALPHPRT